MVGCSNTISGKSLFMQSVHCFIVLTWIHLGAMEFRVSYHGLTEYKFAEILLMFFKNIIHDVESL